MLKPFSGMKYKKTTTDQSLMPVSHSGGFPRSRGTQPTHVGSPPYPIPNPVGIPACCSAYSQRAETRSAPLLLHSRLFLFFPSPTALQHEAFQDISVKLQILSVFRITPLGSRGHFNCEGKGEVFVFFKSVKHEGTKYVTPSALFQS